MEDLDGAQTADLDNGVRPADDGFVFEETVIAEVVRQAEEEPALSSALKAVIEAAIYITDEPLTPEGIAIAVGQPVEFVKDILKQLTAEYAAPDRGLAIRELAGGYKMSTKPEYHEAIRSFVNKLQPPLKLSLAALETLAVVAYKQPITAPEIMDVRGVQGAGVLKTLLDRKLIAASGRKNVIGKPILYKTTREFLIQFGLNSLAELPTLKEFEELGRFVLGEGEESTAAAAPALTNTDRTSPGNDLILYPAAEPDARQTDDSSVPAERVESPEPRLPSELTDG